MKVREKYSLEALRRVQGFLTTNAASLGTVNASGARAELDDVVTQLSTHGVTQDATRIGSQGTTAKLATLRNTLRNTNMRPIAEVASARLRTIPEFTSLKLPDSTIDAQGLIAAAEGMAKAAVPFQDTFTGLGLASDFINQLLAAANALQAGVDTRAQYQVAGVGATAGAASEMRRGRHAVALLDSLVKPFLATNDQLMAEWRNAKRVVSKPGVASGSSAPASATGSTTSTTTSTKPASSSAPAANTTVKPAATTAPASATVVASSTPPAPASPAPASPSTPAAAPAPTASPVPESTKTA